MRFISVFAFGFYYLFSFFLVEGGNTLAHHRGNVILPMVVRLQGKQILTGLEIIAATHIDVR